MTTIPLFPAIEPHRRVAAVMDMAARLDGRTADEYLVTDKDAEDAKAAGLVIVYANYRDDSNMDYPYAKPLAAGAISGDLQHYFADEHDNLLPLAIDGYGIVDPCNDDRGMHLRIDPDFTGETGFEVSFSTDIPHATFRLFNDHKEKARFLSGEDDAGALCLGIVFDLVAVEEYKRAIADPDFNGSTRHPTLMQWNRWLQNGKQWTPRKAFVPDDWHIARKGKVIVVQKDNVGGYVAHADGDNIAASILFHLADDLLKGGGQ